MTRSKSSHDGNADSPASKSSPERSTSPEIFDPFVAEEPANKGSPPPPDSLDWPERPPSAAAPPPLDSEDLPERPPRNAPPPPDSEDWPEPSPPKASTPPPDTEDWPEPEPPDASSPPPESEDWPERSPLDPSSLPSTKPVTVLMSEKVGSTVLRDPARTSSSVMAVIGGALSFVWLTEMVLLWLPLGLQSAAWTFGTVVATVDRLPYGAIGGALLTSGLIRHPESPARIVRRLSGIFAVFAGLFLLVAFLYLPSLPSSFAQAPDVALPPLRRTVAQTLVVLLVAAAACWGVAVTLRRGTVKSTRAPEA